MRDMFAGVRVQQDTLPRQSRSEWLVASLASTGFVVALMGVAQYFDALGIARGDDWSFIRMLQDFSQTGQIELTGWVQMTFVGQSALAIPWLALGSVPSIMSLQVITALLAAGTLVLAFAIARFFLPRWWAALVPLSLGMTTVFQSLAVSVMTDVPALFATLLSLYLGLAWLRSQRIVYFILAVLSGVWAFTIREYGIVALVAIAGTTLLSVKHRRLLTSALSTLAVLAAVLFLLWRSSLPGGTPSSYRVNSIVDYSIPVSVLLLLAISLMGAPATLFIAPHRVIRVLLSTTTKRILLLAWSGFLVVGVWMIRDDFPLGNYLTVYGTYPGIALGTTSIELLSRPELVLLVALSTYSLWISGLMVVDRSVPLSIRRLGRSIDGSSGFLLITVTVLGLLMVFAVTAFLLPFTVDRYLLAAAPLCATLILASGYHNHMLVARPGRMIASAFVLLLLLINVKVTMFSDLVDGMRWQAAERSVASGLSADEVDGGFDWVGFHYPGIAVSGQVLNDIRWWHELFPGFTPCAEVVVMARDDGSLSLTKTRAVPGLPVVTAGLQSTGLCPAG